MNVWIGISMNAILSIDGVLQIVTKFSYSTVVLTSLRFLFAFLSVLCQLLIKKKYKLVLFSNILTIITQLQLATEIKLYIDEQNAYNLYKQLLLLYFDHLKNQNPLLQYLSIIQLFIEVQIQNQQIHQYVITIFVSFHLLVIKRILTQNHQNQSQKKQNQTPLYQIQSPSPRKTDQNLTDEFNSILDHCCQGIIYFSQNLDIQFINEKAYKLLKAKSNEMALTQLHKMILLGLQQDENINRDHKEIKDVASSKLILQKADSKMIESLLASAEKNMKRIESISEKLLDQKILLNKKNKITYSNNEFKQLLLSFFAETHISQLLEHKTYKTYVKINKLKVNLNLNYSEQIILLHFSKINTNQNQNGYVIYMNNVTENEKLQQFIQKYQFQTLHFNSFSHELRTPLNCSLSLLQALKKQVSSNALISQYLDPAIVSNKLLMHQINDILDYASFGLGTFQLNIGEIQIEDIFAQLNEYYHSICQSKGIKLIFQISDNLEKKTIYNDQERILQIFVNLINNSLKFTQQHDSITVIAKMKQNASAQYLRDQQIKFIVKDTGRGISKSDLDAINNILHSTTDRNIYSELKRFTTKYVGLGFTIGNRMSEELACTQKSYFKIRSVENQFTKISFRVCNQLQFVKKSKEATIQFTRINSSDIVQVSTYGIDEHQIPLSTQTFFSHKYIQSNSLPQILLCDDVAFNLISLQLLIKNIGLISDLAYDGQQAIDAVVKRQKLQLQQYRIIFMDIEMPGLNGYQTTKQLLQIDPKLNIIMCSAYDTEDNLSLAVEYGMKDFIIKPVRIEQLKRILSKYFK